MVLQRAGWTETYGTDVSTAIALDTFGELIHPVLVSFRLRHGLNLPDSGRILTPFHLLSEIDSRGIGTETLARLSEFSRTGHAQKGYLLRMELLILVQFNQGTFVAGAGENSKGIV
jgi:hypothetical protein